MYHIIITELLIYIEKHVKKIIENKITVFNIRKTGIGEIFSYKQVNKVPK